MANNNKHTGTNVPALRFPEFSGEWIESKLGDIADFSKGAGISKDQRSEEGNPCILYGELYTRYKSEVITNVFSKTALPDSELVKSKANDIIIPASGETAEDIATARCVPFDNILLGGDLNIIRLHEQDGKFFSYQLNGVRKYDIATVAQGVSVVHLHAGDLKGITVKYPSHIAEQEKISQILGLIDDRIATQSKIIEELKTLRSALRQRLLYQGSSDRIPLLCFAELKNGYAFKSNTYTETGNHAIITISNVTGERYISTEGCNKIQYIPSDIQDHQILHFGDILISMTGNVGRVSMCAKGSYLLNQRVGLLKIKPEYIEFSEFIFQCLRDLSFTNAMKDKGQGAAQQNIGKGDIESYEIPWFDDARYMKSVAILLLEFDNAVLVEEKQYVNYTVQKAWLLSKLFI